MRLLFIDDEVAELVNDRLAKGIFEEARKDDVYEAYLRICDKRFVEPRDRPRFFKQLRHLIGYREERRRRPGGRERWLLGIGLRQD